MIKGISHEAVPVVLTEHINPVTARGYDWDMARHGFKDRHPPCLIHRGEQESIEASLVDTRKRFLGGIHLELHWEADPLQLRLHLADPRDLDARSRPRP